MLKYGKMSKEITIHHEPDKNEGEFQAMKGDEKKGLLHYILFGSGRLVIQHTEVDRELAGTGTGRKLVLAAVEHARKEGLKIVPICPYAKKLLTRDREKFGDVLA